MNVYDSKGRLVSIGRSAGRGGEATVYRMNGRTDCLAKIYEPAPRPNYPDKLAWMLANPPENPTRKFHHASLAWPAGLLYDSRRRLVGYWMPYIRGAVPILDVFNPRRRLETLPNFNRRYLHRAARNLAATIGALHSSGYVVGDINESNVLVTPSALVTLIDTDSFQVNERRAGRSLIHYCPVGKPEYSPPELQGKPVERLLRLPEQDAFGLGVLVFQLLMEGSHPFRAQWMGGGDPPPIEARIAQGGFPYTSSPLCPVRPPKNTPDLNRLHPEIAELFRRCFVDGHRDPSLRPSPGLWERAIAEAEKTLVDCPRGHIYSNHLRACPACPAQPQTAGAAGGASRERRPPSNPSPAASPRMPGFPFFSWRARPVSAQPTPSPGPAAASAARQPPVSGPAAPPRGQAAATSPGSAPNPKASGGKPAPRTSPQARTRPAGFPFSSTWANPQPAASTASSTGPAARSATWGKANPARPGSSPNASPSRPRVGWFRPFRAPGGSRPYGSTRPAGAGGAPASWASHSSPVRVWDWARPRLYKSLAVGAGMGALAGILPGALAGVVSWSSGSTAAWGLLWALGGAAGGMLRGYHPGYRLSQWVHLNIGWQRVWPALGLFAGAIGGGFIGFVLGWWAIFPVFLGLFLGARIGVKLGRKIWQAGNRLGWERIWAAAGALSTALLGWAIARWASASGLGGLADQFAGSLAFWMIDHSSSWALVWAIVGALGGALGGAVAGFFADLCARFSGLVD